MKSFSIPSMSPRMGRPPLGNKPTQIRLPEEIRERIREIVGVKGMAQFIREAVERELKRREKKAVNNSGT